MKYKDHVYDEDLKKATIWFENVNLERLEELINQFQDKPKKKKEEESMMSAIWDEPEEKSKKKVMS